MMLLNLGCAALLGHNHDEATKLLTEGLQTARQIDDRVGLYCALDALGCCAMDVGQPRRAARLLGAAETVQAGVGARILPFLAPLVAQARESASAALGEARFEDEYDAGQSLTRVDAISLALGEPDTEAASQADVSPLSGREAEVAQLVAEGLRNHQIGARLFISEHTVDSHIRSIMNKLGFGSRTQIAAWVESARP